MSIGADIIAAIATRLADHAGLELPPWLVEARAAQRIATLAVTPAGYVALLSSPRGAQELDILVEAVRVGESRLFRHRGQIAALVDDVIPRLRAAGKRAIRVWSAGCSTGEEPYTLAAVLSRAMPGASISIVATDVSAEAIAAARTASYPASALADIPDDWQFAFALEGERVCVRPEIASLVTFERANLLDGNLRRGFDLVWCRNVLIYFTASARQQVIERLVSATAPGGFVFVGYSESLREVSRLQAVNASDAVYYVRIDRGSSPSIPRLALREQSLVVDARPNAKDVGAVLSAHLATVGLRRLVVDLDPAELLDDEFATMLAGVRAAARAAHVELVLKATRSGTRRWLVRHSLDEREVTS